MEWLFGRKKTPDEMLRENQRLLKRSMREMDREKTKLQRQEQSVMMDIRKAAKAQQYESVKIMAKDVVRTRRYINKMTLMRTQIQAVSLKIQTLKSTNAMAKAMQGVTKAMGRMNKQVNMPQLQKIMMEFEKQSEMMDMKQEMMDDTVDSVLGEEEDEEEGELIVGQILDELGLNLEALMGEAPATKLPQKEEAEAVGPDADLQARLDSLRR